MDVEVASASVQVGVQAEGQVGMARAGDTEGQLLSEAGGSCRGESDARRKVVDALPTEIARGKRARRKPP
jgi:hypothetical protein